MGSSEENNNLSSHKRNNDLVELDSEHRDPKNLSPRSRQTTDLVGLFLEEMGRIPLLQRDEEISEAQKVQRHLKIKEQREQAAKQGNTTLAEFVKIINTHDALVAQLNHPPSMKRWASALNMEIPELQEALSQGKASWAQVTGCEVNELEKIQQEGIRAKEHLIKANLRLVVSVAKKYQDRGLELLDLIQEGALGLERAVNKYDPTKGYRFSTYSYWWIRQFIYKAVVTQSRNIRLPVNVTEKRNKIEKAQWKIIQEKGRSPRIEELALESALTAAQIRTVLDAPYSVSLEIKIAQEKNTKVEDLLEAETASPEEILIRESLQQDFPVFLSELTSLEREFILMRFGFVGEKPLSLEKIRRRLKLSYKKVQQIETQALEKLRHPKWRNFIRDYLESLSSEI